MHHASAAVGAVKLVALDMQLPAAQLPTLSLNQLGRGAPLRLWGV